MKRDEFMAQIARLLADMPDNERMEAIRYYNDYLDEAGEENEEEAIRELGNPQEIAANIKANLQEQDFETGRMKEQPMAKMEVEAGNAGKRTSKSTGQWVLIIVLLVFALPILLGVGGGILGIVLGLAGAMLGIIFAFLACGLSMVLGGVALGVKGIWNLFQIPALGFAGLGGGLICIAVGILSLLLFWWLTFRMIPRIWRACGHFISNRRKKGERTA
ncbi:MAG: DUF1700 domain-containing protein [Bacillota bacterium]|nr:DUF1700 domain-containing protein [Bacillota bacterium]